MADQYRIPEAIADALRLEHLRMPAGEGFVYAVIERLAEVAPFVTVAELQHALMIYWQRREVAFADLYGLPTVSGPDRSQ